jgi:hypothetical protein
VQPSCGRLKSKASRQTFQSRVTFEMHIPIAAKAAPTLLCDRENGGPPVGAASGREITNLVEGGYTNRS